MKNRIYNILTCFLISLIFGCTTIYYFERYINSRISLQKYNEYTNIPFTSYQCHIYNHNYNSILIIGDSHAIPLIGMIFNYCKLERILIYYKCIHTTYIVFWQTNFLNDVNMNFSIILLTHHYDKNHHSNSTNLIEKVRNYLIYLKDYSNYIIYILPTPFLLKYYSCANQIAIKYGKRNIDIDVNYMNVDIIKTMKNVVILNYTNFFCNNAYCNLTYSNNCMYYDTNHLHVNFIIFLTPYLLNYIKSYDFENTKRSLFFYNDSYILLNNKMDKLWRIPVKKECKIDYIEVPY